MDTSPFRLKQHGHFTLDTEAARSLHPDYEGSMRTSLCIWRQHDHFTL